MTIGLPNGIGTGHDVSMATASPLPIDGVATLSPNGSKARFGVAYLRALCSQAGVGLTEISVDEDVLAIDAMINFAVAEARVQVKCTGQFRKNGSGATTWPAEEKWWAKWNKSGVPVYFIVIVVDPDVQAHWLDHRVDGTMHHAAAFWVRVDRMAAAPSIRVPRKQRLTVSTFREWAADVDACFAPQGQG